MSANPDFEAARAAMINSQLLPNKLLDADLTAAMARIPREQFLPPAQRGVAYVDEDIPLRDGRHLMSPLALARLIQAAEITPGDTVLDIGCLTGYAAAVMSAMAGTVVAIESDGEMTAAAVDELAALDIANVAVMQGELTAGLADQGPYDVILIEGAVSEAPAALLAQLAEGGRMPVVIRDKGVGVGWLYRRVGGLIGKQPLFDVVTAFLPGFEKEKAFVF